MPTGTGKTETMLALLVAARLPRLLVLVPSDVLREQVAEKFESLGVLQELGVVSSTALRPVVGRLARSERSGRRDLVRRGVQRDRRDSPVPEQVHPRGPGGAARRCSHLFIDEAHHVAAPTWSAIRQQFEGKPVVQFTATPFREDGRHLQGRVIYSFPLREAQAQSYLLADRLHLGDRLPGRGPSAGRAEYREAAQRPRRGLRPRADGPGQRYPPGQGDQGTLRGAGPRPCARHHQPPDAQDFPAAGPEGAPGAHLAGHRVRQHARRGLRPPGAEGGRRPRSAKEPGRNAAVHRPVRPDLVARQFRRRLDIRGQAGDRDRPPPPGAVRRGLRLEPRPARPDPRCRRTSAGGQRLRRRVHKPA